jgi:hypothetical protein
MRTAIMGTGLTAKLTMVSCATLTILVSASVSACSGSSPSATPTPFSPAGSKSATPTNRPSGTPSPTKPSATPSPSHHHHSPAPHRSGRPLPNGAPATGGGGTAGFQDAPLLGLGAAAILAGAGGIAYRVKVSRSR